MKFEYNKRDESERKCVAFIDHDGDLMIKTDEGGCIWVSQYGEVSDFGKWDDETAVHRFYPGDSITITF